MVIRHPTKNFLALVANRPRRKVSCRKIPLRLSFLAAGFGLICRDLEIKSTDMDKIIIKEDCKVIEARNAMLNNSYFNDVAMTNVTISNANLSDLEIEGAQIGEAYIH